ncbi:MAG: radical SAM protein [Spirochaetales bacterium]|nr:radical SAM protein [Spirochaetales bacterium]
MNSSDFYKTHFTQIYIMTELQNHPVVQQVLVELDSVPCTFINRKEEIPSRHLHQHTLFINKPGVPVVGRCPGSKGHFCCNYLTLDLYTGCTIGCTYCIMKGYLNFSPITVNMNIEENISLIRKWAYNNPDSTLRVGTGEVGDSLLFDPLFRLSRQFVEAFSGNKNIYFELKTKTGFVDHLLDIPDKGNAVIGFSLNPEVIAREEEPYAASLDKRIQAAVKAARAGYAISFHFDPVFRYSGWENDYMEVIKRMSVIPEEKVAWISLGTFRYTPRLRAQIDSRWFLFDEFVPCRDKKFRYIQQVRRGMYEIMIGGIRNVYPKVPVYMCMESPVLWHQIFGKKPGKIDDLCSIFKPVKIS